MEENRFTLAGKVALVTGASSGIGAAIAKGLAEAGACVAVAGRRVERLTSLVDELTSAGKRAIGVCLDVTDFESIKHAFDQVETTLGTVDVLVNNAGVANPKNFIKTAPEDLDFIMATNFRGCWHVAQEAAKRLIAADKSGSFINISSVLGEGAQLGQSAYAASKGAVSQMTRNLAIDLMRYGIRVNAIAPGWFRTEMNDAYFATEAGQKYIQQIPPRRLGDLNELIGPVILLASDAGSFVNGAILPVDGALHAHIT